MLKVSVGNKSKKTPAKSLAPVMASARVPTHRVRLYTPLYRLRVTDDRQLLSLNTHSYFLPSGCQQHRLNAGVRREIYPEINDKSKQRRSWECRARTVLAAATWRDGEEARAVRRRMTQAMQAIRPLDLNIKTILLRITRPTPHTRLSTQRQ